MNEISDEFVLVEADWLKMMEQFIMPAALNHMRHSYQLEKKKNDQDSNI